PGTVPRVSSPLPYTPLFRSRVGLLGDPPGDAQAPHRGGDDPPVVAFGQAADGGDAESRADVESLIPSPDLRSLFYEHSPEGPIPDRKSTRLNSSHVKISYAV